MIDCLNNLIGLRGIAGYEDPDSGYYINDLEGITTDQLENISDDEDHYEPRLVWDDIYNRASRKLETDIRLKLTEYAKHYSYIQTTITSQLTDNTTVTQSADYTGWRFNFGYESKHLVLNLVEFQLYLNTSVDFDIFTYDLTTGEQLDEVRFEGTAGLKTYRLLKNYSAYKHPDVFVCYDANLVSTLKVSDYKVTFPCSSGKVAKSGTVVASNFNGSYDNGLSVTYNLECSVSNVVCQSIMLFLDAFLYLLGTEYCRERINSDRINRWTLMDRDDAVSLRDEFKEEYDSLIEGALKGFKIDADGVCFECNRAVNYKTMLP